LTRDKGIKGIAQLDNHFSTIKNILKARPDDFLEMLRVRLRNQSINSRIKKNTLKHKFKREQMMPLGELKKIVRKHQIQSQSQWFDFVRANKAYLKSNKIPC